MKRKITNVTGILIIIVGLIYIVDVLIAQHVPTTFDPFAVHIDGTDAMTANWDIGNYDITLKSLTGDGTIEGATITEGGNAVWNDSETDILDSGHYIDGSIDDEHINWTDVTLADFDYQTAHVIFYSDGSGDVQELALGTNTWVLTSQGTLTAPAWSIAGVGDLLADATVPMTANWDIGNYDITLKSLTGDGTVEGAILTEGGVAVITEADMPAAGADPDVDAAGEIGRDTDDHSLRGFDGVNQFLYSQATKTIQFTIAQPDDLDETDDIPVFSNNSGFSFIIHEIMSWSDADDADYTLIETSSTDFDTEFTITAITVSTDGTGVYYDTTAVTIASGTIESGNMIILDPSTDDLKWLKVTIIGKFDADVN